MKTERYRVKPGEKLKLAKRPSDVSGGMDKASGNAEFRKLRRRLIQLQERMHAEGKHALLVVLQAMDTGGKDSTIRSVFGGVNPQGCRVSGFKAPTELERQHDFLWRVHARAPALGEIGIFNRSHYEDVLVVRVKGLAPEKVWRARYDHINAFEELLQSEGTAILKFYLHISKDYQKERLERRLKRPDKHWKFNPADLAERERWNHYQAAYEEALGRCSTTHAPWYIVPAEKRWYRNLLIAQVLVDRLDAMKMRYPKPDFDPKQIVVK
jgi:PPK2 family polyphosphate:nucleotide phosphotransferase